MHEPDRPHAERQALVAELGWLRRLARSLVRDDAAADDVAQETVLAAMTGAPREPRSLRAWLATVARNAVRRRRRAEARRASRESAVARREASEAETETAERLETSRSLLAAVDALDEPYRTAVRLRWLDGLPPREVAARLGVPPEVAWKRLSRALAMLRARVDRDRGGRRAWIFAMADLGGVRPRQMPWTPVLAEFLGPAAATSAAVLAVAFAAWAFASVASIAARDGADAGDAAAPVDAARSTNASTRRPPRRRAAVPDDAAGGAAALRQAESPDDGGASSPPPERYVPPDRIVGRVLGPDGTPVADASVDRRNRGERAASLEMGTDADGRFVLPQPGDRRWGSRLVVRSPAWATEVVKLPRLGPGVIDVGDVRLRRPRTADEDEEEDIPAPRRSTVVIDLRDDEGRPVPASRPVEARSFVSFDEGSQSAQIGGPIAGTRQPSIPLPRGRWALRVSPEGSARTWTVVDVADADAPLRAPVTVRRAGNLCVVIERAGRGPSTPGTVSLHEVVGGEIFWDDRWFAIGNGAGNGVAHDGPEHPYVFAELAPGTYRLRPFLPGWWADDATAEVLPGRTVRATIVVQPGGWVVWDAVIADGWEAEVSFARPGSGYVVHGVVQGRDRRTSLVSPSPTFPPGSVRWRLRLAERDLTAADGRTITTIEGSALIEEGRAVRLPEGPFPPPEPESPR